jgi:hypothetical protein
MTSFLVDDICGTVVNHKKRVFNNHFSDRNERKHRQLIFYCSTLPGFNSEKKVFRPAGMLIACIIDYEMCMCVCKAEKITKTHTPHHQPATSNDPALSRQ